MTFKQLIGGLAVLVVGFLIGSASATYYVAQIADQLIHEREQEYRTNAIELGVGTYATDPRTGEQVFYLLGKKNPDLAKVKQQAERLLANGQIK